jgi:hypothetical protein
MAPSPGACQYSDLIVAARPARRHDRNLLAEEPAAFLSGEPPVNEITWEFKPSPAADLAVRCWPISSPASAG